MDPVLVKLALIGLVVLGCIGLFFGIGLALAANKFAVEANPKVEEVLEVLAGAQCGGCGYPGCEAYAEAVVHNPDVPPNLCFPGKAAVATQVAHITGKGLASVENLVAAAQCSRIEGQVKEKVRYLGYQTCAGASLTQGGPMACFYACVGLGDCAASCPFQAIAMVDGFPRVDPRLCVGCGSCVRACPKKIIALVPASARVWVPCSTRDPGKDVKEVCGVGCISCKLCVKACPAKAVSFENDRVQIDHASCLAYGPSCGEACVLKCPRKIFRNFVSNQAQEAARAA